MDFEIGEPSREMSDTEKNIGYITAQRDRLQNILIRRDISHTTDFKDMSSQHKEKLQVMWKEQKPNEFDNFLDTLTQTIQDSENIHTRHLTETNIKLKAVINKSIVKFREFEITTSKTNQEEINQLKQENEKLKNEHQIEKDNMKRELEKARAQLEKCVPIFHELLDTIDELRKRPNIQFVGNEIVPQSKMLKRKATTSATVSEDKKSRNDNLYEHQSEGITDDSDDDDSQIDG